MPIYVVRSGEMKVRIDRNSAKEAAVDAIGMLRDTDNIHLGHLVGVSEKGHDPVYLSTVSLMKENGLNYRLVG